MPPEKSKKTVRKKAPRPARAARTTSSGKTVKKPAASPLVAAPPAAAAQKKEAATDDLKAAPPPALGDIPWGYGDNRITVLARDPNWVLAYWEVTDQALDQARSRLGDPHAQCALRVYDTTHRDVQRP